jgi:hypothetical protein
LRAEVTQLKKALATAERGRVDAEKEKDAESAKVTAVTKERNQLLADLKTSKQAQERVQVLVTENTDLKTKLAIAEKTVREISSDKPKKEQEIVDVKRQVEQLRQQLAASQQQNREFEVTVADLRSQLQEAGTELDKAKLTGANPEETARLTKENDMLRKIVLRERQEEARREQAKKLMLAEFDKLQIKVRHVEPADRAAGATGDEIERRRVGVAATAGCRRVRCEPGIIAGYFCDGEKRTDETDRAHRADDRSRGTG